MVKASVGSTVSEGVVKALPRFPTEPMPTYQHPRLNPPLSVSTARVALYVRTYDSDQSARQINHLRTYAWQRRWNVITTYPDRGSAKAGLRRMMRDAQGGRFNLVLVAGLNQFGGTLGRVVRIVQKLDGYGMRFVSVAENIDTDSDTGRLVLDAFAAFERNRAEERFAQRIDHAIDKIQSGRITE